MYQNFYSASDAQIYLTSRDHTKQIKLDTAVGIGYNLTQTAHPIYSLGNRKVQFFSHGNTVANGVITLAFTDEEALKYAISYIALADEGVQQYSSSRLGKKSSNANFINASNASSFSVEESKRLISIGAIQPLFNIKLYLNNESAIRGSDTKVICITGVKIINESMNLSSNTDGVLHMNYTFYFKDIERG